MNIAPEVEVYRGSEYAYKIGLEREAISQRIRNFRKRTEMDSSVENLEVTMRGQTEPVYLHQERKNMPILVTLQPLDGPITHEVKHNQGRKITTSPDLQRRVYVEHRLLTRKREKEDLETLSQEFSTDTTTLSDTIDRVEKLMRTIKSSSVSEFAEQIGYNPKHLVRQIIASQERYGIRKFHIGAGDFYSYRDHFEWRICEESPLKKKSLIDPLRKKIYREWCNLHKKSEAELLSIIAKKHGLPINTIKKLIQKQVKFRRARSEGLDLLTSFEFTAYLGIDRTGVHKLTTKGFLPAQQSKRGYLYPIHIIEDLQLLTDGKLNPSHKNILEMYVLWKQGVSIEEIAEINDVHTDTLEGILKRRESNRKTYLKRDFSRWSDEFAHYYSVSEVAARLRIGENTLIRKIGSGYLTEYASKDNHIIDSNGRYMVHIDMLNAILSDSERIFNIGLDINFTNQRLFDIQDTTARLQERKTNLHDETITGWIYKKGLVSAINIAPVGESIKWLRIPLCEIERMEQTWNWGNMFVSVRLN